MATCKLENKEGAPICYLDDEGLLQNGTYDQTVDKCECEITSQTFYDEDGTDMDEPEVWTEVCPRCIKSTPVKVCNKVNVTADEPISVVIVDDGEDDEKEITHDYEYTCESGKIILHVHTTVDGVEQPVKSIETTGTCELNDGEPVDVNVTFPDDIDPFTRTRCRKGTLVNEVMLINTTTGQETVLHLYNLGIPCGKCTDFNTLFMATNAEPYNCFLAKVCKDSGAIYNVATGEEIKPSEARMCCLYGCPDLAGPVECACIQVLGWDAGLTEKDLSAGEFIKWSVQDSDGVSVSYPVDYSATSDEKNKSTWYITPHEKMSTDFPNVSISLITDAATDDSGNQPLWQYKYCGEFPYTLSIQKSSDNSRSIEITFNSPTDVVTSYNWEGQGSDPFSPCELIPKEPPAVSTVPAVATPAVKT